MVTGKFTAACIGLAGILIFGVAQTVRADDYANTREEFEPVQTLTGPTAWNGKIKFHAVLSEYFLNQNDSYFGGTSSQFLESAVRVGAEVNFNENWSAVFQLCAQGVTGDPDNYTFAPTDDWITEIEFANITYTKKPFSVTLGRQNLDYGDGFLIYDGYSDTRAVLSMPMRSFYAVKGVYESASIKLDVFAAAADPDYQSYETFLTSLTTYKGDRNLYGANLHFEEAKRGTWDLGVFYKDDDSDLQSNTLAVSQRGSYTFNLRPESVILPQLTLGGEIVEEFGSTKVQNYTLTDSKHDRVSFGGHLDSKLAFTKAALSPYLKVRYIYLPGDDPGTDKNEAFDPMFYGLKDWGTWYLGSITSCTLFNYNERAATAELGLNPVKNVLLRLQYYSFSLDKEIIPGAGKKYSNELNIILDYTPKEWFACGVELGYAHPLRAATTYFGGNNDTMECALWAGIGF